jgi:hypothetical protein
MFFDHETNFKIRFLATNNLAHTEWSCRKLETGSRSSSLEAEDPNNTL